jgi:hypothetical protein
MRYLSYRGIARSGNVRKGDAVCNVCKDAAKRPRRLRRGKTARVHMSMQRITTRRSLQFLFYCAEGATKTNSHQQQVAKPARVCLKPIQAPSLVRQFRLPHHPLPHPRHWGSAGGHPWQRFFGRHWRTS